MRPVPRFPAAFCAVALTRLLLKTVGFRRTVRLAQRFGRPSRSAPVPGDATLVVRAVAVAAAFFPGRAICLEQSLAGYLLLRRRGYDAALKVGVQPLPFRAHAWLELDGRPVLENEDELVAFVAFPEAFA
ncbi:MAG: lasso peptide biosynthesis B2 protein [Gemmatimonadales bacterium]